MPMEGLLLMLISTLGIVAVAFVRSDGDRRRTTVGALLIFTAYGLSVIGSKFASSPVAGGAAVLAILVGIVGVGILVWGLLQGVGGDQRAEPNRHPTSAPSSAKAAWTQRIAFAAVFAVIGALTLVLDGPWQKIETGVGLFVVLLLLSNISAYRKA